MEAHPLPDCQYCLHSSSFPRLFSAHFTVSIILLPLPFLYLSFPSSSSSRLTRSLSLSLSLSFLLARKSLIRDPQNSLASLFVPESSRLLEQRGRERKEGLFRQGRKKAQSSLKMRTSRTKPEQGRNARQDIGLRCLADRRAVRIGAFARGPGPGRGSRRDLRLFVCACLMMSVWSVSDTDGQTRRTIIIFIGDASGERYL